MEAKAQELESLVAHSKDEALQNAIQAAECYMKAAQLCTNGLERTRLRKKCETLLSKAEEIKQMHEWPLRSSTLALPIPLSQRTISKHEQEILLEASQLNGFIFPQWTTDPDDSVFDEVPDGSHYKQSEPSDLNLSNAQRKIFHGWRRVSDIGDSNDFNSAAKKPLMVPEYDIDLVQDITTDCSVVASLCAETARASKGHDKLLASVMYPYDRLRAQPKLSKNGKYIFRLHFNGCFRKVVIDDRLPVSKTQRSLHVIDRKNPGLIWPALLEKAYLKVRGGYDFPGSNSGTDLWVLTGWIPEQVFLQSEEIQTDQLWNRVYKAFGYGDVMITLGTGGLTQREEKGLGLAGEHDYAILDMKEEGQQHLLLVKNPWCDGVVWRGSSFDSGPVIESRTPELQEVSGNTTRNPGTFWMSFENVTQHFESIYLNWNPGLFRHRQDHHFSWVLPNMKSPGSFAHSPQYSFRSAGRGTVWILLSRHFITGEQELIKNRSSFVSNTPGPLGFISLYVFEANGERVYLNDDALHRGAYVDSPQTLARLEVLPSAPYTVVVAEHGLPLPKYSFTLSFFSRSILTINTALDRYPYSSSYVGAWTVRTAGGNAGSPSYPINPQFCISVPATTDIVLILETDEEELAVHVKMVWAGGSRVTVVTPKDIIGGSGDYRRGCALASLRKIAAGRYTIVCSTFEAGQTGNFTLRVRSMINCDVTPLIAETAGRLSLRLPLLIFRDGVDRMLAPLKILRMTKLRILGKSTNRGQPAQPLRPRPFLKISVEMGQGPNKIVLDVSSNGEFSDAPMGIRTNELDLSVTMNQQGGLWVVVERLDGRHELDGVELEVLSDSPVDVGFWGT